MREGKQVRAGLLQAFRKLPQRLLQTNNYTQRPRSLKTLVIQPPPSYAYPSPTHSIFLLPKRKHSRNPLLKGRQGRAPAWNTQGPPTGPAPPKEKDFPTWQGCGTATRTPGVHSQSPGPLPWHANPTRHMWAPRPARGVFMAHLAASKQRSQDREPQWQHAGHGGRWATRLWQPCLAHQAPRRWPHVNPLLGRQAPMPSPRPPASLSLSPEPVAKSLSQVVSEGRDPSVTSGQADSHRRGLAGSR